LTLVRTGGTLCAMLARLASNDSGEPFIQLIVMAVFGTVCAVIAHGRGRSAVGWFFFGFFAPCIALIVLLVLPDMKKEAEARERQERTNRRLAESLAKDRQVADARHAVAERRLAAHDEVLQVDTRTHANAPPAALPPPLPGEQTWYYASGSERVGPVSTDELRRLLAQRTLTRESLVWKQGMAAWQPLASVPELAGEVA